MPTVSGKQNIAPKKIVTANVAYVLSMQKFTE
jgi:hypothetical protein